MALVFVLPAALGVACSIAFDPDDYVTPDAGQESGRPDASSPSDAGDSGDTATE